MVAMEDEEKSINLMEISELQQTDFVRLAMKSEREKELASFKVLSNWVIIN